MAESILNTIQRIQALLKRFWSIHGQNYYSDIHIGLIWHKLEMGCISYEISICSISSKCIYSHIRYSRQFIWSIDIFAYRAMIECTAGIFGWQVMLWEDQTVFIETKNEADVGETKKESEGTQQGTQSPPPCLERGHHEKSQMVIWKYMLIDMVKISKKVPLNF